MKVARKFSLLLGLLCLSITAYAHQPDLSSTILAEKGDNEWVLQIRASLTAFDYEVKARFGDSAYASPEEFRELVIEHLQREIILRFNDGTITALQDGVVKLGHETTATFHIADVPGEITSLFVRNAAFSNISHNQSALYVVKEGFDRKQFVLKGSNDHSATLEVSGTHFVLAEPGGKAEYLLPMLLLIVGLAGALAYFAWSRQSSIRSAATKA
ncbi:hypothetical protein [Neolewinella agarilytica]|uniref:PEP-CTERM protein-sorting domain-containing protein n=1 Tax=Neolewinella agarilytica TaxID=478744 RepID=A0A1H9GTZ2_9BACT|nr:hypothetical protein [Neolewinella agarilytica]SEQ53596.1 hypothetical protein SAMN05444359_111108 [Neolewinella agarilytica]